MVNNIFCNVKKDRVNAPVLNLLENNFKLNEKPIYILGESLLSDMKDYYNHKKFIIVAIPDNITFFVDFDTTEEHNHYQDFLGNLYGLACKYNLESIIGRPENWINYLIKYVPAKKFKYVFNNYVFNKNTSNALISLIIGSYNPKAFFIFNSLFTPDQLNFIHFSSKEKLTHTSMGDYIILNKIKMDYYGRRKIALISDVNYQDCIIDYFNTMHVDRQIDWEKDIFLSSIPNKTHFYKDDLSIFIESYYNINFHDNNNDLFTISNEIPSDSYLFDNLYFISEKTAYDPNLLTIFEKITKNNVICKTKS